MSVPTHESEFYDLCAVCHCENHPGCYLPNERYRRCVSVTQKVLLMIWWLETSDDIVYLALDNASIVKNDNHNAALAELYLLLRLNDERRKQMIGSGELKPCTHCRDENGVHRPRSQREKEFARRLSF